MRAREPHKLRAVRYAGLRHASGVQLKYFLRYQNLTAGMSDRRLEVIQRVLEYIEDDTLPGEIVDRAIVEFLEYRNKRVYLYQADPSRLCALDASRFAHPIGDWSEAHIVLRPEIPRENYAYLDQDHLRVSFSETHRQPTVSMAMERVGWRRVGKVIVLDVERRTGFATLSFDSPGRVHPHGSRPLDYYNFYRERAESLLGTQLIPFPLRDALFKLEAGDLVRLQQGRGSTLDGRVDIVASGLDVRAMTAFQAVKPSIAVRDSGRYVWLPAGLSPHGGPHLLREVPTEIYGGTSMVRFTRDSLVHEVRYVLEQVRAHA
ncbi:MAG: hypothetical protein H0T90_09615 [Gemmatimonadales bacterium]|nr:hypothetical protein [Gemmatimonadales bacterium]